MTSAKLKVNLGMHMVRYGCDLLGPGTLKSALSQLKNKSMNWADWADFSYARSDGITFGLAINHNHCLLITGTPL